MLQRRQHDGVSDEADSEIDADLLEGFSPRQRELLRILTEEGALQPLLEDLKRNMERAGREQYQDASDDD